MLSFIISLLPEENLVPKSFSNLIKSEVSLNEKVKKICPICSDEILKRVEISTNKLVEKCSKHSCVSQIKNSKKKIEEKVEFLEFNLQENLASILKREWRTIQNYKSIFNRI